MIVRLAATALLAVAGFGCGGRAVTAVVSSPAEQPVVTTAPPPATRPEAPTRAEAPARAEAPKRTPTSARVQAPSPRKAERLDAPSRTTPPHPTPQAGKTVPEVRHTLRRGQTLYSLARLYDVPVKQLMSANGITNPRSIPVGAKILIPGARVRLPYHPEKSAGDPGGRRDTGDRDRTDAGRADVAVTTGGGAIGDDGTHGDGSGGDAPGDDAPGDDIDHGDGEHHGDDVESPGERPTARVDPADALQWPLQGAITGPYGRRGKNGRHSGVDIDGRKGDPILAAASGVVLSAGMDGQYGRCIEIDHGDGFVTLYAHAERLLVHAGDRVRAGQRIAEVGRSGNARGTHLHFEVRRDGRTVNPMPFLRDSGPLTAGVD